MAVTLLDYAALKRGGIMRQVTQGLFSLRLHVIAGNLDAKSLRAVAEIAERHGNGAVHVTSRQGIEIPFVPLEHIEAVRSELAAAGLELGACGPRVRTVTGCQGAAVCPHGLVETKAVCEAIDKHFAGLELPHKLKFGVSGCRNSCLKPQENDIGLMGVTEPTVDCQTCDGCMVCAASCESDAIDSSGAHPVIDPDACSQCGNCIASCPTDSMRAGRNGFVLYLGGRIGKSPKLGERFGPLLTEIPEVLRVLDALVALYRECGQKSERFGVMLDRLPREQVEELIHRARTAATATERTA
jgi:dissimilatory sulfite reductase (desulfoviridin) alpha/beta subunit